MGGLYPSFDDVENFNSKCLLQSKASKISSFQTINDKVLQEMNQRAKQQLEKKIHTEANPFSLGQLSQPRVSPNRPKSRFSAAHKSHFAKLAGVDTHPTIKARTSRGNLRQRPELTPASAKEVPEKSPKRSQVDAEESPTKRLRSIKRAPAVKPNSSPSSLRLQKTIHTSASSSALRRAIEPSKPVQPAQQGKPTPAARAAAAAARATTRFTPSLRTSASTRTLRPKSSEVPTRSVEHALTNLPSVPSNAPIPSYARPTQSALRKSVSMNIVAKSGQPPAGVKKLLNTIPPAPKKSL